MASSKVKLARRLMSNSERKRGVTPFNCNNWEMRRRAIAKRVKRKQSKLSGTKKK